MGVQKERRPILQPGASYGTTEQDTGQRWTDGKKVFRKVVVIPAGPNNNTIMAAHGIANLDTVVVMEGTLVNAGGTRRPLPWPETGTPANSVNFAVDDTNVSLTSGGNWSTYSGHATLLYTKDS